MEARKKDKKRFESGYIKYPDGCWRWMKALSRGYGQLYFCGKYERTHRVSWMLHRGNIPDGMLVLHKCNHRWCVNPEHLYIGTHSDNTQDSIKAGTHKGNTKLAKDDVICIKKMLRDKVKPWLIAWIYQISQGYVSSIKTGVYWAEIKI